jgi:hypothetical protein
MSGPLVPRSNREALAVSALSLATTVVSRLLSQALLRAMRSHAMNKNPELRYMNDRYGKLPGYAYGGWIKERQQS